MAKKEITKIVSNDPKLSDVITVEDLFKAWSDLADAAVDYSDDASEENAQILRSTAESYTRIVDALERE